MIIYVIVLALTGVVGFIVSALVWQHRPRSGSGSLSMVFFGVMLWAFGQAGTLAATEPAGRQFGTVFTIVSITLTALAWLSFSFQYTGHDQRIGWTTRAAVAVPAVAFVLTAAVNPGERFYTVVATAAGFHIEWGPLMWLFFGYIALAATVGGGLLLTKTLRSRNVYRKRTFLILVGGMSMLLGYAASMFGLTPAPSLSLAPLIFLPFGIITVSVLLSSRVLKLVPADRLLGLLGSRFQNIAPIARDLVIETIGSGVIVFDENDRIVDLNPVAREMLATTDRRIVGRRFREVIDRDAFDGDPGFLDETAQTGSYDNIWVAYPDDKQRCYDIVVTDLAEHRDDVSGQVAIIHDVTEQQLRKRELTRRTEQLERQNERLDEFASVVSHDLRNPLQVLRGSLDGARRTDDPAHLDRGLEAVERMETLIDDMLTLAREGQTVEETTCVDVATLAREAWGTVDTGETTLDITVDDLTVGADEDRLRRVFENLYRNAVEHGSPSPDSHARQDAVEHGPDAAELTVRVGALTDNEGFVVEDDGSGIPADQREAVLGHGFSSAEDGTGFGLSIVENIVQAHGGSITVGESELPTGDGESPGARFEIRLPTRRSRVDAPAVED